MSEGNPSAGGDTAGIAATALTWIYVKEPLEKYHVRGMDWWGIGLLIADRLVRPLRRIEIAFSDREDTHLVGVEQAPLVALHVAERRHAHHARAPGRGERRGQENSAQLWNADKLRALGLQVAAQSRLAAVAVRVWFSPTW